MNPQERLKNRIVEAVTSFEHDQLSLAPSSVAVDLHDDTLVVTFRGATSPAEKFCARDVEAGRRLEQFYAELFDVVRPALEGEVTRILGRTVARSKLSVDIGTGDGIILFTLS